MPQRIPVKHCPSCAEKNISSRMRLFQLSFDKAVLLCCKKDCLGGLETLDYIDRSLDEIRPRRQPKSKKSQTSLKNDSVKNVDSPASSLPVTSSDNCDSLNSLPTTVSSELNSLDNDWLFRLLGAEDETLDQLQNLQLGSGAHTDRTSLINDNITNCDISACNIVPISENGDSFKSLPASISSELNCSENDWLLSYITGENGEISHLSNEHTLDFTEDFFTSDALPIADCTQIVDLVADVNEVEADDKRQEVHCNNENDSLFVLNVNQKQTDIDNKSCSDEIDIVNNNGDKSSVNNIHSPSEFKTEDVLNVDSDKYIASSDFSQGFGSAQKYPFLSPNRSELSYIDALFYSFVHNSYIREIVLKDELDSLTKRLVSEYCETLRKLNQENNETCSSLQAVKEEVVHFLSGRRPFVNYDQDNVVTAFALLAAENEKVKSLLEFDAFWMNECHMCGTSKSKVCQPLLPSFDQQPVQLKFPSCFVYEPCALCKMPRQKKCLKYSKLPDSFAFHFAKGLPHSRLEEYDFQQDQQKYKVAVIIQDRGVQCTTWVRHLTDGKWMHCQNSEGPQSRFSDKLLDVQPHKIRIVIWEKCRIADSPKNCLTEINVVVDLPAMDASPIEILDPETNCDTSTTSPILSSLVPSVAKTFEREHPATTQRPKVIYVNKKGYPSQVLSVLRLSNNVDITQDTCRSSDKIVFTSQPCAKKRKLQSCDPLISPMSSEHSNASDGDASVVSGNNVMSVLRQSKCIKMKTKIATCPNVKKVINMNNVVKSINVVNVVKSVVNVGEQQKKARTQEKLKNLLNGSDLFGIS